ncbi:redox-active disulfide protein 2 [candidate division SR1 bacterium RAAC1_SR1_1]|nr:redox-active disulfide protein 2 [candidate division SR1 bacterium RAAC1_SR1_1]
MVESICITYKNLDNKQKTMIIKILGTGCPKCKLLEQSTRDAVSELGLKIEIIKVNQIEDILQYDIMALPGIVIDEIVVSSGKVLNKEEIKELLSNK